MSYRALTLEEKEEWSKLLGKLPFDQHDIHYTPEYYELYERNGDGTAICFVYEKNDDVALYPFLMNTVNDLGYDLDNEYNDIQGAYGYNGCVYSSCSVELAKGFSNSFINYCCEKNIIAEFTRFNPIINNHEFSDHLRIIKANENIIVDLKHSEKDTWENIYDRSVRKNVKKAIRNNLIVKQFDGNKISDWWYNKFKQIYFSTLKRRYADKYYYFSDIFFSHLKKHLKNETIYFFTVKDDIVISCELITYKDYNAYSFLGGTLSEYFPYRPNDFLKHEIILYLKSIGVKYFCLGGGSKVNDSIYKYKKSFSKNGDVNFYIGKNIYNKEVYDYICQTWSEKYPEISSKYSNMLLRYREIK